MDSFCKQNPLALDRENNVQLPDEYDQISKDLYLFRAISPSDLHRRIQKASAYPDTFTIVSKGGRIRTLPNYDESKIHGATARLEGQLSLLLDFGIQEWVGDFIAVFGIHDSPQAFIGYDHRSDLESLVEDGEYYEVGEELDTTLRGWEAACPYRSPSRKEPSHTRLERLHKHRKTFISDHSASFDLCYNPSSLALHGYMSAQRPHVQDQLVPIFSLSKTNLHVDILAVPTEQWVKSMPSIPWSERSQNKLLWRGSNTGSYYSKDEPWQNSHRVRMIKMADTTNPEPITVEILPAPGSFPGLGGKLGERVMQVDRSGVNTQMLDIAFAGHPIRTYKQVDWSDVIR